MYDCGVGMMFSPGRRAVNHLCELEPHESSAVPSGSEYQARVLSLLLAAHSGGDSIA